MYVCIWDQPEKKSKERSKNEQSQDKTKLKVYPQQKKP